MLPRFTANRRSLVWRSCAKAAPAIARLGLFRGRAVQHSAVNRFGQCFTVKGECRFNHITIGLLLTVKHLILLYISVFKTDLTASRQREGGADRIAQCVSIRQFRHRQNC